MKARRTARTPMKPERQVHRLPHAFASLSKDGQWLLETMLTHPFLECKREVMLKKIAWHFANRGQGGLYFSKTLKEVQALQDMYGLKAGPYAGCPGCCGQGRTEFMCPWHAWVAEQEYTIWDRQ